MRSFNPFYEQLDNIPNQKLNLYFVAVTLTRGEKMINGSGHLQMSEGEFELAVLNNTPPDPTEESFNAWTSIDQFPRAGKLRSAEDYCYEMIARDSHGNHYECKYVELRNDFESSIYKCTFKSRITVRSEEITKKSHVSVLFRDKYSFAGNEQEHEKTTFPTYLQPFPILKERWRFSVGNLTLSLQSTTDGHQLDIQCVDNEQLNAITVKRITDALNFVMGTEHTDYYRVFFGDNNSFEVELAVRDKPANPQLFNPPYFRNGSWGDEAQINIELFKCYYIFLENNPENILNKIHKRIIDSNSGYYYRHGLIISIGIESILKHYFPKPEEVLSDTYLQEVVKLKDASEEIEDPFLKIRYLNFIKSLTNTSNYHPGKMLSELEKTQIISAGSVNSWKTLRNRYAHGEDFNEQLPKAVNLVRKNNMILYELIFHLIGYRGKCADYSHNGGTGNKIYPPSQI